jgi:uncharacterized protein
MIADPDTEEARLLGAFRYARNRAVLHCDARWMPSRRRLWSSWNYLMRDSDNSDALCVTYWMNSLQNLPTRTNLFVTLNPTDEIHPKAIHGVFDYDHPVFDANAMSAQQQLWSLQGRRRTWFCGSYFGYGFHEDGCRADLPSPSNWAACAAPGQVPQESGRIHLPSGAERVPLEAAE